MDSADDELGALYALARAALPRFGFADATAASLVHHRENTVFRLEPPGEPAWALRVHRPGYRTPMEIASELAWMAALRDDAGIDTPRARPGVDGGPVQSVVVADLPEPRNVTVLAWIDGTSLDADRSDETYALVGRTSALIQRHGRGWTPPAWFSRPTWDADALVGKRCLWGDYADLAALDAVQLVLLDRAADLVRTRLARFGRAAERFGLTHGDLMPDNVLVAGGHPVVIDFDDGGYGWYLYDLATLLAVEVGGEDYARIRDAWLRGYAAVTPVGAEDRAEIDTLVMARLLLALGWMHTRRETPLAQGFTVMTIALATVHAERVLAADGGAV